ncbi:MAG: ArsA-related P-loop ATPase, partial [Pseudonocardiaceae bacterium]
MSPVLFDRRLLFVTGKGGVGRSTVAASLAVLAASMGQRTLACELDSRGDMAALFECRASTFVPNLVEPNLWSMTMDTEAALQEYLRLQLRVPVVGRFGPLARMFDYVAAAAPGVREILTVGKIAWEVRENHYDLVVVDAVASGHILSQLGAPAVINRLIQSGLIRQQTQWVAELLGDAAITGVVVVTTAEEMPISETIQ